MRRHWRGWPESIPSCCRGSKQKRGCRQPPDCSGIRCLQCIGHTEQKNPRLLFASVDTHAKPAALTRRKQVEWQALGLRSAKLNCVISFRIGRLRSGFPSIVARPRTDPVDGEGHARHAGDDFSVRIYSFAGEVHQAWNHRRGGRGGDCCRLLCAEQLAKHGSPNTGDEQGMLEVHQTSLKRLLVDN
jgi:hypothetical protein